MSKSWLYLGVICGLAIVVTSCGGDGGKPATTPPAASPSAVASPTTTAAVAPTTPQPVLTDKPPLVPAKSTAKPISMDVTAGLIPPTDADNWTRTVAKGRPDPFAALALQPIQDPTLMKELAKSNQKLPITKVSSNVENKPVKVVAIKSARVRTNNRQIGISQNSTAAIKPNAAIRSTPKPSIAFRPLPQPLKTPVRSTTVAPPKLEPKLARAVGVSGIIQVDGRTQVIVKLPNESFSRYVDVGDRLSDGKIMVKRVEGEQTLSPIVVLEEMGMEVTRRVGDTGEATTKAAAIDPSNAPSPSPVLAK
jgi:hypothetical protein